MPFLPVLDTGDFGKMQFKKSALLTLLNIVLSACLFYQPLAAQMITGVWKGKVNKKKTEIKIIQKGDSLLGTSYYYETENNYRRYSIKGYFDPATNQAVWWDDQLLEEKNGKFSITTPGKIPYLTSADFNCPGSDKMFLDGNAAHKNNKQEIQGPVHLEKTNQTFFPDEWDFIIDNYTAGANDPFYIDSVASIGGTPVLIPEVKPETNNIIKKETVFTEPKTEPVFIPKPSVEKEAPVNIPAPPKQEPVIASQKTKIENEFRKRDKIIAAEIPLIGDSIELRFYDNAEIDGDSISLFLNNKLIFEHIRLTGSAYTIKLPVADLAETNELVMVAENLGSIPPNTSYMLAIVNDKRYDAMLKSTEESSAVIRLFKPKEKNTGAAKN